MVLILTINKGCEIKEINVRDFKIEDLYKKCGFKKSDDFLCRTTWNNNSKKYNFDKIQLWAKSSGRAGTENKYDLPPPIDKDLFFGNMALIAYNNNETYDLTKELWNNYYEYLFGGFEDLDTTAVDDENEEDELANIPDEMKTKDGYLKDGFVVDDDSELSFEEYEYSDEEN